MIPMNPAAVVAVALVLIGLQVNSSIVDYNNPVRSAQEDEVKSSGIFNESSKFKFFAGYLKAHEDGEPEQFLYYWFVESASDPSSDPVVLWLNGGPGGSSLVGAASITGPTSVEDGKVSLVDRKFSWNKLANMLYIEGPIGVGYSYSPSLKVGKLSSDDSTARANYLALKNFMQKFPRLAGNPLYLTGVSYAGVYLPTLGVLVDKDPELNLKGLAIENGRFDGNLQDGSMALKLYYYGLIGDRQMGEISDACCKGAPPTRENCDFDRLDLNKNCRSTVRKMYGEFSKLGSGLDLDNIYNKEPDLILERSRELDPTSSRRLSLKLASCAIWDAQRLTLSSPQYRELVHIPEKFTEVENISYCKIYTVSPIGMAHHLRSLISSERNLTMLIYNGDTDFKCDSLGTRWFVQGLGRRELTDYEPWRFNGQIAGFVQQFDGLTFATVLGAGHNPSAHIPDVGFAIFEQFLRSKDLQNVDLKQLE